MIKNSKGKYPELYMVRQKSGANPNRTSFGVPGPVGIPQIATPSYSVGTKESGFFSANIQFSLQKSGLQITFSRVGLNFVFLLPKDLQAFQTDGWPTWVGNLSEFEKVQSFHECQIAGDFWHSSIESND